MNHFVNNSVRAGKMTVWQLPLRLLVAVLVLGLAACANTAQRISQAPPRPMHEYLVYQIDDHRYITIRSTSRCIFDQMDGEIFYYDTSQNVRTSVAYTGNALNGIYKGYYAVNSGPQYVAIPSLVFSQTKGMLLHINYSHDGGRTFQWFLVGYYIPTIAILIDNEKLFISTMQSERPGAQLNSSGVIFDISKDMDEKISHYDVGTSAVEKYGTDVSSVPAGIRSPSRQTRWVCPGVPEK